MNRHKSLRDSDSILRLWVSFNRKFWSAYHDVRSARRELHVARYYNACERLRPLMVRHGYMAD